MKILQVRRATTAQLNAYVGNDGEIFRNTTTGNLHLMDGVTAGGTVFSPGGGGGGSGPQIYDSADYDDTENPNGVVTAVRGSTYNYWGDPSAPVSWTKTTSGGNTGWI